MYFSKIGVVWRRLQGSPVPVLASSRGAHLVVESDGVLTVRTLQGMPRERRRRLTQDQLDTIKNLAVACYDTMLDADNVIVPPNLPAKRTLRSARLKGKGPRHRR